MRIWKYFYCIYVHYKFYIYYYYLYIYFSPHSSHMWKFAETGYTMIINWNIIIIIKKIKSMTIFSFFALQSQAIKMKPKYSKQICTETTHHSNEFWAFWCWVTKVYPIFIQGYKNLLWEVQTLVIVSASKNLTWRQQLFYKLIGMTFLSWECQDFS